MDPLQEAIQQLVETKIFSVEGVKAIQQLRTDFANLTNDYKVKVTELKKAHELNFELSTQNECLTAKLNDIKNREASVSKREETMTRLEIEKSCADKMAHHTLSMFNTVFANATLKNSIMREVINPTEYTCSGNTNTTLIKDKVIEETSREVGG